MTSSVLLAAAGAVVVLALLGAVLLARRSRRSPLSEVSAFQAARDLTTRWSAGEPTHTPGGTP